MYTPYAFLDRSIDDTITNPFRVCIRVMVNLTFCFVVSYNSLISSFPSEKAALGLTEKEILTLPYESLHAPRKTVFSYQDVHKLAIDKFATCASRSEVRYPGQIVREGGKARAFTKWTRNYKRLTCENWSDMGECLPWQLEVMVERMEAKQNPAQIVSAPVNLDSE